MDQKKKHSTLDSLLPESVNELWGSICQFPYSTKGASNGDLARSAYPDKMRTFTIRESVIREIRLTVGSRPAESGGPLGGDRATGQITHFHFDDTGARTGVTYSPNYQLLNRLFADDWNPKDVNLLGFVHSHPAGLRQPSGGDLEYARRILEAIPDLKGLYLPIVVTEPDSGAFQLFPYLALRHGRSVKIERLRLHVVPDSQQSESKVGGAVQEISEKPNRYGRRPAMGWRSPAFERVRSAYDLAYLSDCRVIVIGAGGASAFVEELVRAGIGQIILIDGDTVSEVNLATQQTYRRDLGRFKVEAIAERLADINEELSVVSLPRWLESFDDNEFAELIVGDNGARKPVRTLLCGLTDNFDAQARVNRLALQFGIPSLCAQVYLEGRGAEVTFTYPGLTPACHRCILSSRYRAYLEEGFQNDVTTNGTPIFSTTRLNAIKGFIALAILHHGGDHPRWGGLLKRIGNRNLIQIRMDPDFAENLGFAVFDQVFQGGDTGRIFFDEAVWQPMDPESATTGYSYNCPDCGGTGNLGEAIASFGDTRKLN